MPHRNVLQQLTVRLARRVQLDDHDREALAAIPCVVRSIEAPAYIIREGENSRPYCSFIVEGFAIRHKLTMTGARQIVALNLPGDFLNLQHLYLQVADHNVQALSRIVVADLSRSHLQDLVHARPAISRALWVEGLVDASIGREWLLNVGRRDAKARIAHVLCEFGVRLRLAGIAVEDGYQLPMSQEQLGDAVGLTAVHVNRTIKTLVLEGIIAFDRRHVRVTSWARLMSVGDFSALYLHADDAIIADVRELAEV